MAGKSVRMLKNMDENDLEVIYRIVREGEGSRVVFELRGTRKYLLLRIEYSN